MFSIITGTWNPVSGCFYDCVYCWARNLATKKLKDVPRYSKGFRPSLNENEFHKKFREGDVIFVSDMGDLFGNFVHSSWIKRVFAHISLFPETTFLFMTKNPVRYLEFCNEIPKNSILGTTIETTNDLFFLTEKITKAPVPSERIKAFKKLLWDRKLLSIEPILDFDLDLFSNWICELNPFLIYVGYDNYGYHLNEPTLKKTNKLIEIISKNSLVLKKTIRPAWFECNTTL